MKGEKTWETTGFQRRLSLSNSTLARKDLWADESEKHRIKNTRRWECHSAAIITRGTVNSISLWRGVATTPKVKLRMCVHACLRVASSGNKVSKKGPPIPHHTLERISKRLFRCRSEKENKTVLDIDLGQRRCGCTHDFQEGCYNLSMIFQDRDTRLLSEIYFE